MSCKQASLLWVPGKVFVFLIHALPFPLLPAGIVVPSHCILMFRKWSRQYPHFTEDIEVQRSKLTFSKSWGSDCSYVKTEAADYV